jgi:hypothetical protein
MNSTAVIAGDVSVITDIIIAGIPTLHALIIGDKAAKSKSVEEITFIVKVLLSKSMVIGLLRGLLKRLSDFDVNMQMLLSCLIWTFVILYTSLGLLMDFEAEQA